MPRSRRRATHVRRADLRPQDRASLHSTHDLRDGQRSRFSRDRGQQGRIWPTPSERLRDIGRRTWNPRHHQPWPRREVVQKGPE